jgi:hypothetical protein
VSVGGKFNEGLDLTSTGEMVADGSFVQFGTGKECWNYVGTQEMVGQKRDCLPNLTNFERNAGFKLAVKDVDGMIFFQID